jgi:hypothetical protein
MAGKIGEGIVVKREHSIDDALFCGGQEGEERRQGDEGRETGLPSMCTELVGSESEQRDSALTGMDNQPNTDSAHRVLTMVSGTMLSATTCVSPFMPANNSPRSLQKQAMNSSCYLRVHGYLREQAMNTEYSVRDVEPPEEFLPLSDGMEMPEPWPEHCLAGLPIAGVGAKGKEEELSGEVSSLYSTEPSIINKSFKETRAWKPSWPWLESRHVHLPGATAGFAGQEGTTAMPSLEIKETFDIGREPPMQLAELKGPLVHEEETIDIILKTMKVLGRDPMSGVTVSGTFEFDPSLPKFIRIENAWKQTKEVLINHLWTYQDEFGTLNNGVHGPSKKMKVSRDGSKIDPEHGRDLTQDELRKVMYYDEAKNSLAIFDNKKLTKDLQKQQITLVKDNVMERLSKTRGAKVVRAMHLDGTPFDFADRRVENNSVIFEICQGKSRSTTGQAGGRSRKRRA